MTFDEAYKHVKNKRNIAPNNGFIEQLLSYENVTYFLEKISNIPP